MVAETVTLEGHIIDSGALERVFAAVVADGGTFEVLEIRVGRTHGESSFARLSVAADDPARLDALLDTLSYLGAALERADARFAPAEADGILPDEFYSSTNFDTWVRIDGTWRPVEGQRMDCALVHRGERILCVKQRAVRAGEPVCLRGAGLRVQPPERARAAGGFGFMGNDVSAETNKALAVAAAARWLREARAAGERIAVVAGPAIVHSGGDGALARLVRAGWIDVLLSGNAFAVHDLEKAIVGTSLGVCQLSGRALEGGNRNHLFAINAVNRAGGVVGAVRSGLAQSGVMHALVERGVPFVLAGSIRDDGPLLDVVCDVRAAQEAYAAALEGVGACLMLASALHSIAVGNLLPARVRTVCVDMAESVPVKLSNRGSQQAVGLVTDVGYFLERLERELCGEP